MRGARNRRELKVRKRQTEEEERLEAEERQNLHRLVRGAARKQLRERIRHGHHPRPLLQNRHWEYRNAPSHAVPHGLFGTGTKKLPPLCPINMNRVAIHLKSKRAPLEISG